MELPFAELYRIKMKEKEPRLNLEKALSIIQPQGLLSRGIKGFESREAQQHMMRDVIEAYETDSIALIEAGTGTGKSVAYLIPAMLWAARTKERTLISTHTISLQEQLVHKDIPFLLKALSLDLKVVLVKGMNNYVCLRKLEEAKLSLPILPIEEVAEIEKIDQWKSSTREGSRSDLPFVPSGGTWEKIGAESDTCNHQDCPFYENCYYIRARKEASEAQLLIANHHMLFSDLSIRAKTDNYNEPAVLPVYQRIVLDEAHHIEDIATEHFALETSYIGLLRLLARLASDRQGKVYGKLPFLKAMIQEHFGLAPPMTVANLLRKLSIDLPGMRQDLTLYLENAFQAYTDLVRNLQSDASEDAIGGENKLRLRSFHKTHPAWESEIVPRTKELVAALQRYSQVLYGLETDIESIKEKAFEDKSKGVRFDIAALAGRLVEASVVLENFLTIKDELSTVRWIQTSSRVNSNIFLLHAELDMAKLLSEMLFSKFSTVVLCSATLATNKQFDFIRNRLGLTSEFLPNKKIIATLYESPFDYQKQALFAIPTDMPHPSDREFTPKAVEAIWQAIQASRGNAFVLFTSYSMMKASFNLLEERLKGQKYVALKQGDAGRQSLLNTFKNTERSVLFGTDSFWEGVDVVGEALRCVIIVKLPFKVPSEPIIQARSEAISAKGGDPFMDYTLPQAIVKFKQGFGRLIRNRQDRGCVVCLDNRLLSKGYGRMFLNSLPGCQFVMADRSVLSQQMVEFYKRTHYLTKAKE
jgi:ATP-dependent DNA helicase DinG